MLINGFDVNVIATGSGGNCTILDKVIALDMGIPFKDVRKYAKDLQIVFISHEHGDHFKATTVTALAHMRPTLRFVVGPFLVDKLVAAGVDKRNIDVLKLNGGLGYTNGYVFYPVKLRHNVENYGVKIHDVYGQHDCFYAVDTGDLDGITAKNCDVYLLEANHTRAELEARAAEKMEAGEYAYEINAAQNHLSVEQAQEWLVNNMGPNSVWIPMHGHATKEGENNG